MPLSVKFTFSDDDIKKYGAYRHFSKVAKQTTLQYDMLDLVDDSPVPVPVPMLVPTKKVERKRLLPKFMTAEKLVKRRTL